MPHVLHADKFPLVRVELGAWFPAEETQLVYDALFAMAGRGRVAMLIDMRAFDAMRSTARERKAAASVMRANLPALEEVVVCEARVVSSQVTRCVLTAMDWLARSKWPCATFTSLADAERWVLERLAGEDRRFDRLSA